MNKKVPQNFHFDSLFSKRKFQKKSNSILKNNLFKIAAILLISVTSAFGTNTTSIFPPPANDLCADAIEISCGETLTGTTAESTGTGAPADTCDTTAGAPGNWYSFTGTGDIVELSLCGSDYDTKIQVYSGDCGTLTCVGGNDDSCGLQSEFTFLSQAGTEYIIYVFGYNTSTGNYSLSATCTTPPSPPGNNECVDAVNVEVNADDSCTLVTSGTIAGATGSTNPNTCGGTANNDVWFSFVANNETQVISLNNIVGSTTNMYHAVYSGACGTLADVLCSDANQSIASNLIVGDTYYIRVYTFNNDPLADTTFDVCINQPPPPPGNDECIDAVTVDVNPDSSCTLVTPGTILGATGSTNPNTCNGTDDDDVWYQFVATSESHSIQLLNVSGSTTDLYHVLYEGVDCNNLTQLNCSDPNTSTANGLTIGNTYYIRVYSWTSTPLQDTTFNLCVSTILPPQQCLDAAPFCSQEGLIFPNVTGGQPADPTIDYECLGTQPNPSWFFLQIDETGDLAFEIVQNTEFDANGNPIGQGLDVDFIAWGPFSSVSEGCGNLNPTTSIDCSYSAAPVENFAIPGGQAGEIYILLITNFDGDPGFISLQQTDFGEPGSGSTDCDIVLNCNVDINEEDQIIVCNEADFLFTTTVTGPVESYQWYQDDVLLPDETSDTILVTESGTYTVIVDGMMCDNPVEDSVDITFLTGDCTITPTCSGVDFEENFGTGTGRVTTPFTTYTFNGTTQIDDGQYAITHTSAGLNTGWFTDMEDHTEDDTDGRMLFVNASFASDEFYRRTITLDSNLEYTFNAWITTVYDTDTNICGGTSIPSNVIFRIEDPAGNLIAETNTGDIANGTDPNWQEFMIVFNTANNTDVQLVLINNSIGGCGNDLAIDDITLSLASPQPAIVTPNNITVCDIDNDGFETFDLESQIPLILNGQDATLFNVSFHLSEFEAGLNENPITTPSAYVNTSDPETIFVRVEKVNDVTCFSTVSFDLILDPIIDLTTNLPATVNICSTDAFPELDATPTNTGINLSDVTYEWTDASGAVVSTDAMFTPLTEGVYTVTINYPECSTNTFTVDVMVTDTPVVDLGADEILCDGATFEIVPTITGDTANATYLWSTGETTPTITVDESGTYTLDVTSGPCMASDNIDITISEALAVDLGEDFTTCAGVSNTITATSTESDVTYTWYLNGTIITGESNQSLEVVVPSNAMGTQTYSVEISKDGCVGTDEIDINLYDIQNCIIPEGISPNGDGLNDCMDLTFLADRAGSFSVEIFNRYGTSLFDQNNYVNQWCGQTMDGEDLPTGTYYYVMKFENPDAEYGAVKTGWIYLNRESN